MKLNEILLNEKKRYSWLQQLCIKLWGDRMYLSYDELPHGKGNSNAFKDDALEYLNSDQSSDEFDDIGDWFTEGASFGGTPSLTKELYDNVMISCQENTKKDLILYKYGNAVVPEKGRWLSMTIQHGSHTMFGKESQYSIKSGTPVIWPQGLADKTEVIINSSYL